MNTKVIYAPYTSVHMAGCHLMLYFRCTCNWIVIHPMRCGIVHAWQLTLRKFQILEDLRFQIFSLGMLSLYWVLGISYFFESLNSDCISFSLLL
jgi:hypothetical protein